MIPKLYVARISILTVCHVKDLNWAKTNRWTPRSTATQAPAHPTVVQWCQKNGVEISKFWMIQKPYILYIKKNKKDCYKMISGHHNSRKIWIHQNMSGNILYSKKYIRSCLVWYCVVWYRKQKMTNHIPKCENKLL